MKKGLNAWAFPNEIPMEKRIVLTAKAGYDGFEVLFEKEGFVAMDTADQRLKEIKAFAGDQGVAIPSLVGTHYESMSLTSGDPEVVKVA